MLYSPPMNDGTVAPVQDTHTGANGRAARYSFGATSAIITNLALITALTASSSGRASIIGGLLIIALADNISDALGIHIHQETEYAKASEVWFSTFTNFTARLLISTVFIILVLLLPLPTAILFSLIYGMAVLAIISFIVAREKGRNPWLLSIEHIAVATVVVIASRGLGNWIVRRF
jgi:vacuolar iron transporter family protein